MKQFFTSLWQSSLVALLCAAAVVTPVAVTTSCSSKQVVTVITDITKISPIVINVLTLACAFTPAAPLCSTGAAVLKTTVADVQKALAEYQQQAAAGGATLSAWTILDAAFKTFEAQTAAIFDLFHISGAASQTEAMAVAAAAQTLLSVIEALFPPAPAAAVAAAEWHRTSARETEHRFSTSLPPGGVAFFNLKAWEKDYNHKVDAAKKAIPRASLVHVKA